MLRTLSSIALFLAASIASPAVAVSPKVDEEPTRIVVTAAGYRLAIGRHECQFAFDLRDRQGRWRPVVRPRSSVDFGILDAGGEQRLAHGPARIRHALRDGAVVVGLTTILTGSPPTVANADFVCTEEGVLLRFTRAGNKAAASQSAAATKDCWALPRIRLAEDLFDGYLFWDREGKPHSGRIRALGNPPVYAGVGAWGRQGDTAAALAADRPAVAVTSQDAGVGLAAILVDYAAAWRGTRSFVQWHMPQALFLYPAIAPAQDGEGRWGWLAPIPTDPTQAARKVASLAQEGRRLADQFSSIAPPPEDWWTRPVPDFPAALRRTAPVEDIRRAAVYTINEPTMSLDAIETVRKTGSDVLIRGWFKWGTAPDWRRVSSLVPEAHRLGALFGGGITCSALYHGESGLSDDQVRDMATRGPEGQLVDAWGEHACRHGTLSNPKYLEFLRQSCRKQVEAGADYLFMDEINAALQQDEGFDDYSIADFRRYLLQRYGREGWSPTDGRWREVFQVNLQDRTTAPGGTMESFQYRAYLKAMGFAAKPHALKNPLSAAWHEFRRQRDDRAWKWLSDSIRADAASLGRRVLLSGNGLAPYVDLQVLGVWGNWLVRDQRVDLSESQIEQWGSIVAAGHGRAGKPVPVVLFHDWGFGGFPWMEVSPEDRRLWIRVRGAEIYAAGGFFAFPIRGPHGNDARLDGTLPEVARQSAFYQRHRDLYLDGEVVGFQGLDSPQPDLSLALWRRRASSELILHVVNRQARDARPVPRKDVAVSLPLAVSPRSVRVISPDWDGEKPAEVQPSGDRLRVLLPQLDAYAVAVLSYDRLPDVRISGRRVVPSMEWSRPERNEFQVEADGNVRQGWELPGMLQGQLHASLRNPPTFIVRMPRGGSLRVHVRAVATLGARLEWQVDGRREKLVDLPDRDRKNNSQAREYDQTFSFPIPPGQHRVRLDNIGGDWASIAWYAFDQ